MTVVQPEDRSLAQRVTIGVLIAVGLYCVGYFLFVSYTHVFDAVMTRRIEGYAHFGWLPLALLVAQAYCGFATKKPEIILIFFLFFGAIFAPAFAWSGPGDEAKIASSFYALKSWLYMAMPIVNAILCRLVLLRLRKTAKG